MPTLIQRYYLDFLIFVLVMMGITFIGTTCTKKTPPPQDVIPALPILHQVETQRDSIDRAIADHSALYSLDPRIIHGIIRVESAYDPLAIGPPITIPLADSLVETRALGLGQIIPEYWLGVYPQCGTDLHSIPTNICYTTLIYSHFLSLKGTHHDALLAYNGCPPTASCSWYAPEVLSFQIDDG